MAKHDDRQNELIREFLKIRRVAVIGVSRDANDYSRAIFRRLKENGFQVFGVNPNFGKADLEGDVCYAKVSEIPGKPVDGAFLVTAPEKTVVVTQECIDHGVGLIWMHRSFGQGSYSPEAENLCRDNNVAVITRGCVMMYCAPVDGAHKIFRWILGCPKI